MNIRNYLNYDIRVPQLQTEYDIYRQYGIRRAFKFPTNRDFFSPTSKTEFPREQVPIRFTVSPMVDYPVIYGAIDGIVASYWQTNLP